MICEISSFARISPERALRASFRAVGSSPALKSQAGKRIPSRIQVGVDVMRDCAATISALTRGAAACRASAKASGAIAASRSALWRAASYGTGMPREVFGSTESQKRWAALAEKSATPHSSGLFSEIRRIHPREYVARRYTDRNCPAAPEAVPEYHRRNIRDLPNTQEYRPESRPPACRRDRFCRRDFRAGSKGMPGLWLSRFLRLLPRPSGLTWAFRRGQKRLFPKKTEEKCHDFHGLYDSQHNCSPTRYCQTACYFGGCELYKNITFGGLPCIQAT